MGERVLGLKRLIVAAIILPGLIAYIYFFLPQTLDCVNLFGVPRVYLAACEDASL